MDITGKVDLLLPLQTGQGKNGTWKKQEFVLLIEGTYPKKVCFSLWGDKIDQANLKAVDQVQVSFDLESREYNGRLYTEAKAWKVSKDAGGSQGIDTMPSYDAPPFPADQDMPADDLPF